MQSHRLHAIAGAFVSSAVLSSCAVTRPEDINDAYRDVLDQRHNHYTLKEGDTVTIKLYNRPGDLNQSEVIVLPDGRSDIFFMDSHLFLGKTTAQLEAELKSAVADEVREAEVSIQVKARDEVVYLVGQFERPGAVTLTPRMTLGEAISSIGGLRVTGDTDYALLRRPFRDRQHPDLYRLDLNDEVAQLYLLPNDQILVQRTFLASVVNYIREYITSVFPGVSPYTFMPLPVL